MVTLGRSWADIRRPKKVKKKTQPASLFIVFTPLFASLFYKYISKAIVATNGIENEHSSTLFLPPKNSKVGSANPIVGITGYFLISSSGNKNIP
jgi:hypothetical protein